MLSLSRIDEERSVVRIYNAQGQLMVQKEWLGNTLSFDVSQWTNGVYVVQSQSIVTAKEATYWHNNGLGIAFAIKRPCFLVI